MRLGRGLGEEWSYLHEQNLDTLKRHEDEAERAERLRRDTGLGEGQGLETVIH